MAHPVIQVYQTMISDDLCHQTTQIRSASESGGGGFLCGPRSGSRTPEVVFPDGIDVIQPTSSIDLFRWDSIQARSVLVDMSFQMGWIPTCAVALLTGGLSVRAACSPAQVSPYSNTSERAPRALPAWRCSSCAASGDERPGHALLSASRS